MTAHFVLYSILYSVHYKNSCKYFHFHSQSFNPDISLFFSSSTAHLKKALTSFIFKPSPEFSSLFHASFSQPDSTACWVIQWTNASHSNKLRRNWTKNPCTLLNYQRYYWLLMMMVYGYKPPGKRTCIYSFDWLAHEIYTAMIATKAIKIAVQEEDPWTGTLVTG